MSQEKTEVDVEFIRPFIDATLKVLATTANIAVTKDVVFVRKTDQVSGDISAIIAMNSDKYLGSMAIAFEEECFLWVVENMLGEKFPTVTPDIQDAAAELCNQVFGMSKKVLNEMGHAIRPAIPTVIAGKSHSIRHPVNGVCIAVRFKTEHGGFVVETVISPLTEAK